MAGIVGVIARAAGKTVLAMLMKLATERFIEDVFIWTAEKLATKTDSKVDDELVAKIKEQLSREAT